MNTNMAEGNSGELSQPHQNPLTRKLKKILNTRLDNDKVILFYKISDLYAVIEILVITLGVLLKGEQSGQI